MFSKRLLATITLAVVSQGAFAAGPAATVADLAWMTGTWSAPAGPNTLEENWIVPGNGSMAALVRMTGAAGVSMWELITIEETDGSLTMNVQQWNKGFEPRAEAQKLELSEITENSVSFTAVTEGGMKSLGYSREGDTFTIHLVGANGNPVNLALSAVAK
jgi:hypothetical protein